MCLSHIISRLRTQANATKSLLLSALLIFHATSAVVVLTFKVHRSLIVASRLMDFGPTTNAEWKLCKLLQYASRPHADERR